MGTEHSRKNSRDSNVSVLNANLEPTDKIQEKKSVDSNDNIIKGFKKVIDLPIENEYQESEEFNLEDNKNAIKDFVILGDEDSSIKKPFKAHKNNNIINAPKQKIKLFNEQISPFKLNAKTFGVPKLRKRKKQNSIISDFQKICVDSKSCNDKQSTNDDFFDEAFNFESETERTTPNVEDLKNLQYCRKKMAFFRDSIDNKSIHSFKDEGKIEYIFSDINNNNNKNEQNKQDKFWSKYIRLQKSKLSSKLSLVTNNIKKSETVKNKKLINNNLFILGVLESAAKEKKRKKMTRYTSNA